MSWACEREWEGAAFVIAGGPSVKQQNLELLRGRKVIVINSSVHVVPWADMLFFGDSRWWAEAENRKAVEAFKGIAVTTANITKPGRAKIMGKAPATGLALDKQKAAMRRTSLTGAINLAFHRGANMIVLLGADGKALNGVSHHHKPHRWPPRKGCWDEQKKDLVALVKPLQDKGITVLNASPGSAWTMWPVMSLVEALTIVDGNRPSIECAAMSPVVERAAVAEAVR